MTIELNDKEAELYRMFCENRDNIEIMLLAGVFSTRRSSVELHFDMEGNIGSIFRRNPIYKTME